MAQHKMSSGRLLDEKGRLAEAGYAFSLVKEYDRKHIKAGRLRIKEWDYYLIYCDSFGIALTVDDNSYMGLLSVSLLDFETPAETTKSLMSLMPLGKTGFPPSSEIGDVSLSIGKARMDFYNDGTTRRLVCDYPDFRGGLPFKCDITLTDAPRDSMVIATPFDEKDTAFYYNQKIVGMTARGSAEADGRSFELPEGTLGLLDWGRGVWTYDNTWHWSAAMGRQDGHLIGFNLGCGFGNTSAASENMLFVDGVAHKLEGVDFGIPTGADGKDDYMSPWLFATDDGRLELTFTPIIDRRALTSAAVILSDQHQVFGRFDGHVVTDDGSEIKISHLLGFAEKVRNKW